jgi:hypothetical protein
MSHPMTISSATTNVAAEPLFSAKQWENPRKTSLKLLVERVTAVALTNSVFMANILQSMR